MIKIKIERGVKITPITTGGGTHIFPFAEMKKGESFFYPSDSHKLQAASQSWRKRGNESVKFTVRQVKGGARIWRIE